MSNFKDFTDSLIILNERIPLWMKFIITFCFGAYCTWMAAQFHFNTVITGLEKDSSRLEREKDKLEKEKIPLEADSKKLAMLNNQNFLINGILQQKESKIVELQAQKNDLQKRVEGLSIQLDALLKANNEKDLALASKDMLLRQIDILRQEKQKVDGIITIWRVNPSESDIQETKRKDLVKERIDAQIYRLQQMLGTGANIKQ